MCFLEVLFKVFFVCKESWINRGKFIKGFFILGFLGCYRKVLGVWVERNILSKGILLWFVCRIVFFVLVVLFIVWFEEVV